MLYTLLYMGYWSYLSFLVCLHYLIILGAYFYGQFQNFGVHIFLYSTYLGILFLYHHYFFFCLLKDLWFVGTLSAKFWLKHVHNYFQWIHIVFLNLYCFFIQSYSICDDLSLLSTAKKFHNYLGYLKEMAICNSLPFQKGHSKKFISEIKNIF